MSSPEKILVCFIFFETALHIPSTTSPLSAGESQSVLLISACSHCLIFFIFTENFQRVIAQGQHWWFIFLPLLVSSIVVVTGIFPFAFTWGSLTCITGRSEFYTNSVLLLIRDQGNQPDPLCWIQEASGGVLCKASRYNEQNNSWAKVPSHSTKSESTTLSWVFPFCHIKM